MRSFASLRMTGGENHVGTPAVRSGIQPGNSHSTACRWALFEKGPATGIARQSFSSSSSSSIPEIRPLLNGAGTVTRTRTTTRTILSGLHRRSDTSPRFDQCPDGRTRCHVRTRTALRSGVRNKR